MANFFENFIDTIHNYTHFSIFNNVAVFSENHIIPAYEAVDAFWTKNKERSTTDLNANVDVNELIIGNLHNFSLDDSYLRANFETNNNVVTIQDLCAQFKAMSIMQKIGFCAMVATAGITILAVAQPIGIFALKFVGTFFFSQNKLVINNNLIF